MPTTIASEGTLKIAVQRLLSKYPLFGGLVATWRLIANTSINTIGIRMSNSGFDLAYNPDFVAALPMNQLVGILHHEARHVVYEHVLMRPEDYADTDALTIAQEVTANENLPEVLPKGAMMLKDFPQLKPDTDTDSRYRVLARPRRKQSVRPSSGGGKANAPQLSPSSKAKPQSESIACQPCDDDGGQGKGSGGRDEHRPEKATDELGGINTRAAKSTGKRGSQQGKEKSGKTKGKGGRPGTLDDHSGWQSIREQETLARWIVDSTVQEVLKNGKQLDQDELVAIDTMCKQRGLEPGGYYAQIDPGDNEQKATWRTILRRYVGRELKAMPSYARPPRRFPHLLGVVPGTIRRDSKPRILAAIDTSGSMTDEMLAEISSELKHLARDNEVTVAECDSEIHRVYRYTKPITKVHGRGGTSFRPVLDRAFLTKQKADLVVLFTDGDGDAPEKPPKVPVVWVIVGDGEPPMKWGGVIRMKEPQEQQQ